MDKDKTITCLGTGSMGAGLTLLMATRGYRVQMYGRSNDSIRKGFMRIKISLKTMAERGLLKVKEVPLILGRIKGVTTLEEALDGASLLIENLPEDPAIKGKVLAEAESLAPGDCFFVSNCHALPPSTLEPYLQDAGKLLGAHFMYPPVLGKLVEIVPSSQCYPRLVREFRDFVTSLGKEVVVLKKEIPGFIMNRLKTLVYQEAFRLCQEGLVSRENMDTVLKTGVSPLFACSGLFSAADQEGLHKLLITHETILPDLSISQKASQELKDLVFNGHTGITSGQGFREWSIPEREKLEKTYKDYLSRLWKKP